MPAIDMTGKKFNHWTVIERAPNNARGDAMWLCECDCENHTRAIVKGSGLRSGHSKSCGCIKIEAAKQVGHNNSLSLVGKMFGKLQVLEKAYSKDYKVFWKCKCECGNITYVSSDKLISGHTSSCGCLTWNNLQGKIFGKLTVLEQTKKRTNDGTIIWKCQCSCPSQNIIEVSSTNLLNGASIHCGCEGYGSKGEHKISILLRNHNIPFKREVTFDDCLNPETNQYLRYDFYVNNQYLIEFDGEQHFHSRENGYFTEDYVKNLQEKDKIKNQWCFNHNIPLIRIPYTYFDDLKIEDLILETSSFIVKE